ncbi:MAG: alanine racemase [Parcubacteria group bacterium Gr01-1014_19]|nr:MAG: alanine racemase [Parcubacteria group bacterium Gr01-1014_19]
MSSNFKVWIEIYSKALQRNYRTIRSLLKPKTKLFAVVKSNAYGHGLVAFSKLADRFGVDGFCVDSVVEGVRLREEGITKTILVLGPTFKNLLKDAAKNEITITVSSLDALKELRYSKYHPEFHLKIDTGMHRQGFYTKDLPLMLKTMDFELKANCTGVYTHFASAKDINYPTFTDGQFIEFQKAIKILEKAGLKNLLRHAAATGGTLVNQKYHLDAVRIGIGLYGLWPSTELGIQLSKIKLEPVLSWKTLVSEVKELAPGDFVGYDLIERIGRKTRLAVLPIGYWHGYPRALTSVGEVLVSGKKCRVLGRVSMDMIVVDVTGIPAKRGSIAVLLGKQGAETIDAYRLARKAAEASYYELVTRINPLIERVVK